MPLKSDFADVEIDERPFAQQLMERLDLHAKDPQKIAIVNADQPNDLLTYRNLRLYISALADFLRGRGFKQGEVAAILSPNVPQFAIVFGAVVTCGGALSGVSFVFIEEEIRTQLEDCQASLFFCHELLLDKARTAARSCSRIRILIVITEQKRNIRLEENEFVLTELFKRNTSTKKTNKLRVDVKTDPVLLSYSSGTTGFPKGVVITNHNLSTVCASYESIMNKVVWTRGCKNYEPWRESLILVSPFYHIHGIFLLIRSLMDGTQIVVMKAFNEEKFCSLVQKYKPKMQFLMPSLLAFLAYHPCVDNFDLSSLTLIISLAAPFNIKLSSAIRRRLTNIRYVSQVYGMTELTGISHYPHLADTKSKNGATGKLGPNHEIKVVCPETGEELRLNKFGEICIKGPVVMREYLNDKEATKAIIDNRGFLHTGDFGYVDSNTHVLHIVDRIEELIRVNGRRVAPSELENILLSHPTVADCAVVGIKNQEGGGELPKAFVVLKGQDQTDLPSEKELIEYVNERVTPFKQLKGGVRFCTSIPKNLTGQHLRRVLRDQAQN